MEGEVNSTVAIPQSLRSVPVVLCAMRGSGFVQASFTSVRDGAG
jgi:hypothetical protein